MKHLTHRYRRVSGEGDRGSMAAYLVITVVAMLALAGLVFDGGAALAARGAAESIALQAASAGADAMRGGSLRGGGDPDLDPSQGSAAAQAVIDAAGVDGEVSVAGQEVIVQVHVHKATAILSVVGVDTVGGSATATAFAVKGMTAEGK
jgi:hypothetical protein